MLTHEGTNSSKNCTETRPTANTLRWYVSFHWRHQRYANVNANPFSKVRGCKILFNVILLGNKEFRCISPRTGIPLLTSFMHHSHSQWVKSSSHFKPFIWIGVLKGGSQGLCLSWTPPTKAIKTEDVQSIKRFFFISFPFKEFMGERRWASNSSLDQIVQTFHFSDLLDSQSRCVTLKHAACRGIHGCNDQLRTLVFQPLPWDKEVGSVA